MQTHPSNDAAFSRRSSFSKIRFKSGILTVAFAGPSLAERESTIVEREISAAIEAAGAGLRMLILDMANLELMSSIGLGVCIDARNAAEARRAKTIVYRLTPRLRELFRMTSVDRLYTMLDSPADLGRALAA